MIWKGELGIVLPVTILLSGILVLVSLLVAPRVRGYNKMTPYECGFEPHGGARVPFDIQFLVVGLLFVVFDLEIVYCIPIGVLISWVEMKEVLIFLFFLLVLGLGLVLEWKKGGLDW